MIEGVGLRTVQDRNPRRLKRVVCIFVATHSEAVVFGKKRLRVTVVKPKK
jgi:3D (Asp-Asp-Asp) domain-containing protein